MGRCSLKFSIQGSLAGSFNGRSGWHPLIPSTVWLELVGHLSRDKLLMQQLRLPRLARREPKSRFVWKCRRPNSTVENRSHLDGVEVFTWCNGVKNIATGRVLTRCTNIALGFWYVWNITSLSFKPKWSSNGEERRVYVLKI